MYLETNKKTVLHNIDKQLAETKLKIEMLKATSQALETIKHYKTITKRTTDAIKEKANYYASYTEQYNIPKMTLYLNERIYKTSAPDRNGVSQAEYYNSTDEVIYLTRTLDETTREYITDTTTEALITVIGQRLDGLTEHLDKLNDEKNNLDAILDKAIKIEKLYKELDDNLTYTTRQALKLSK